jgi:hypothetical protein
VALFHRQARLGPVQNLNLTLLVGAQNYGVFRGIQAQPNDVLQSFAELGIAAEFEGSHPVRL